MKLTNTLKEIIILWTLVCLTLHQVSVKCRTISEENIFAKNGKPILLDYAADDDNLDVDNYLENYGYLTTPKQQEGKLKYAHSEEARKYAISTFQRNADLKVTGEMNKETIAAMRRPRCGITDYIPAPGLPQEYNAGLKWMKDTIKWNIGKYSKKLTEEEQREAIGFAFLEWTSVCGLHATHADDTEKDVDIRMQFASGDHGTGTDTAFDGKGGVVGHAFGPPDGRVHFDEDEKWGVSHSVYTVDLRAVAVHELGHALGLYHSFTRGSIMSPFYSGAVHANFTLHEDDIAGIQSLYGPARIPPPSSTPEPTAAMTTVKNNHAAYPVVPIKTDKKKDKKKKDKKKKDKKKDKPKGKKKNKGALEDVHLCNATFDAVAPGYDGNINIIIGKHVYQVKEYCHKGASCLIEGFPKHIRKVYKRAPKKVLAAAYVPDHRHRTYLFSGKKIWRYTKNKLDDGYPKRLNKTDLPHRPTAAVILKNQYADYHFYVYGGKKYFWELSLLNEKITSEKMRVDQYWTRLPKKPDAITQFYDGHIYVFKGKSYLKYDHLRGNIQKKRLIGPAWIGGDCGYRKK